MTLLDLTPWWWTRKEDQKAASAPLKAYTFESAEQKGNFFCRLLSQLYSPKDREVFQTEKWWKPHQRQTWHGMAHDFCLMCGGLTSPCISKGKLDKRIALTEIQSWHFYDHHPWRWKLPLHAVKEDLCTDLCLYEPQHVGTEREFQSSMYFTWNQ